MMSRDELIFDQTKFRSKPGGPLSFQGQWAVDRGFPAPQLTYAEERECSWHYWSNMAPHLQLIDQPKNDILVWTQIWFRQTQAYPLLIKCKQVTQHDADLQLLKVLSSTSILKLIPNHEHQCTFEVLPFVPWINVNCLNNSHLSSNAWQCSLMALCNVREPGFHTVPVLPLPAWFLLGLLEENIKV